MQDFPEEGTQCNVRRSCVTTASELFPRLLDPESIRDTIARGVSNGQIAYVGKAANGKYLPFNFERTITPFDVEISEEMYILTKETAEAYRAIGAQPTPRVQQSPQFRDWMVSAYRASSRHLRSPIQPCVWSRLEMNGFPQPHSYH